MPSQGAICSSWNKSVARRTVLLSTTAWCRLLLLLLVLLLVASSAQGLDNLERSKSPPPPEKLETTTSTIDGPRKENGILVLETVRDLTRAFFTSSSMEDSSDDDDSDEEDDEDEEESIPQPHLMLVLSFTNNCKIATGVVRQLEQSIAVMEDLWNSNDPPTGPDDDDDNDNYEATRLVPLLAKMPLDTADPVMRQHLNVQRVPSFCFFFNRGGPSEPAIMLKVNDRLETAEQIARVYLQYYYRLLVAAGPVTFDDAVGLTVPPKTFPQWRGLVDYCHRHYPTLLHTIPAPLPPAESTLQNNTQVAYTNWLVRPAERELPDEYVVFVQCRSSSPSLVQTSGSETHEAKTESSSNQLSGALYELFNELIQASLSRQDRFYAALSDCEGLPDGSVWAWTLDAAQRRRQPFVIRSIWVPDPASSVRFARRELIQAQVDALGRFHVVHSSPSVLWFDRRLAAPIAFPHYRQVHLVLVLDFHHLAYSQNHTQTSVARYWNVNQPSLGKLDAVQRSVVSDFRRVCQDFQRTTNHDMVCLIVPSTEIRILTTMGIDIWSPLDELVRQGNPLDHEIPELLPLLLLTDGRSGATERYFMDRESLLAGNDQETTKSAIEQFVKSFWKGELLPELKTSSVSSSSSSTSLEEENEVEENQSGVRKLTARRFRRVLATDQHFLILFTSSGSCGYCKRAKLQYNLVAELFRHVGWTPRVVTMYTLDVTKDEIPRSELNLTLHWIPELVYVRPSGPNRLVPFSSTFQHGSASANGEAAIAGVRHYSLILEWFLDVADFTKPQFEELWHEMREWKNRLS